MGDQLKSRDELLELLSNCVLALALLPEEHVAEQEKAADALAQHVVELDERFPEWRSILSPGWDDLFSSEDEI